MITDYSEQIAHLTAHPDQIRSEWGRAEGLFKYVGMESRDYPRTDSPGDIGYNGCLTLIKGRDFKAVIGGKINEEITAEIKADERIPGRSDEITIESLPVFAEWQNRIDNM